MIECILCLNKVLKKNSILLNASEDCDLTVEELIKLHFSFYEAVLTHTTSKTTSIVCKTCYSKLESFHEFFCAVKSNYKVSELTTIFVKNEENEEHIIVKEDVEDDLISNDFNSVNDDSVDYEPVTKKRKSNDVEQEETKKKQFCDLTEEEIDVLKIHTDLKCEKCSEELTNWIDIRSHYRQKHKVGGYLRCCGRKLDRVNELKEHASWHLNPHIFQCHVCGKSTPSRRHLKLHEEMHIPDEERQYTCDKCPKKFVNKFNLNMHIKLHEKDGKIPSIPCSYCDKLFKTEHQLKSHTNFCHKESSTSYICHICSKVLKSKYTLDIHVKAHTNPDDPIECDQCGHILKNKRRFAVHMSKHRSEAAGPYECEKGCGKVYKNRSAMLDHILFVHTKNRFSCSVCEKEFKHKKSLENHEVTQHGGLVPYSCPFCDRTFKDNANMHSHKKRAHPEEYKTLPAPSYLRG